MSAIDWPKIVAFAKASRLISQASARAHDPNDGRGAAGGRRLAARDQYDGYRAILAIDGGEFQVIFPFLGIDNAEVMLSCTAGPLAPPVSL
jgi:hypothetical protein